MNAVNWKTAVILAVILAILGVAVLVESKQDPAKDRSDDLAFKEFKTTDATRVEVRRGSDPAIVVEKDGDDWTMREPVAYPAAPDAVKALLNNMEWLKANRTIADERLEKFDFGDVAVRATVVTRDAEDENAEPTTWEFEIGRDADNGKRRYLRVIGETDRVLVVDKDIFEKLEKPASDYRRKRVFGILESATTGIDVAAGGEASPLALRKRDSLWRLDGDIGAGYASELVVKGLLETASKLEVAGFVESNAGLAKFGLDAPGRSITLSAGEERSETLLLGKDDPVNEGETFAKLKSYDVIFRVAAKGILEEAGKDRGSFRAKTLLVLPKSEPEAIELTIADADTIAIIKSGTAWTITKPKEVPADATAVTEFINTVRGLEIAGVAEPNATAELLPKYGLHEPSLSVTIKMADVERSVTFGKAAETAGRSYVKRGEESVVLEASIAGTEAAVEQGWVHFRNKNVFKFSRWDAQKLVIAGKGAEPIAIEKDEKDSAWRLGDVEIEEEKLNKVLDTLPNLKAVRFDAYMKPEDVGLEPALLTVTATVKVFHWNKPKVDDKTPESIEEHVLKIGHALDFDGGYWASVDGVSVPFVIEKGVVDALRQDWGRRDKVFSLTQWDIASFRIQGEGLETIRFEKDEFNWRNLTKDVTSASKDEAKNLTQLVGGLKAHDRFPDVDLAAAGLEPPAVTITITTKKEDVEKEHVLHLGGLVEGGTRRWASAPTIEAPFQLDRIQWNKVAAFLPDGWGEATDDGDGSGDAPDSPGDEPGDEPGEPDEGAEDSPTPPGGETPPGGGDGDPPPGDNGGDG